jgi:hypothetical protein
MFALLQSVITGFVPVIHVFRFTVDGRDRPGHDARRIAAKAIQ